MLGRRAELQRLQHPAEHRQPPTRRACPNTDTGIALILPITCNADDTNGISVNGVNQDTIPYAVREALAIRVLQLGCTTPSR